MAWVVLLFAWVLGRPFQLEAIPTFLFYSGYKLNGCHLTATSAMSTNILCLT